MTCSNSCCHDDCCPEVVPVTINNNTYALEGAGFTVEVVQLSDTQVRLDFAVDAAGYWQIAMWFTDSPTPSTVRSLVLPTTPNAADISMVTAADGTLSLTITNTGAARTWYMCATMGAGVIISAGITIGV